MHRCASAVRAAPLRWSARPRPVFCGAVETRIYENGVLQGKAVKQSGSGEVEERQYVDGKLNGKATVLYSDSSKEMRTYKVRTNLYTRSI